MLAWLQSGRRWKFSSLTIGIDGVDNMIVVQTSECYASTALLGTFDLPTASLFHKTHFVSAPPPIVKLARKRNPHFALFSELSKASQKCGIDLTSAILE